uniref:Uncharacterized protein n=1 Tax=Hippocampus comes TaxID=109280 RepID=A0A3Q2Y3E8_HIPCM
MWLLLPSTRADMTFPKAESDRLILVASFSLSPCAPVLVCLSLPARSTRLSLPTRMWFSPSSPNSLHSTLCSVAGKESQTSETPAGTFDTVDWFRQMNGQIAPGSRDGLSTTTVGIV